MNKKELTKNITKATKQAIVITEADGTANIDWNTRSMEDSIALLKAAIGFFEGEIKKRDEAANETEVKEEPQTETEV